MQREKRIAAALAVLSVVVMPSVVGWLVWQRLPALKDVSVFAEAFGNIVGPLFAALAFAGLIYTALMQREELSLQREELKETRKELKRTADAQEQSEAALRKQVEIARVTARLNTLLTVAKSVGSKYKQDYRATEKEIFELFEQLDPGDTGE